MDGENVEYWIWLQQALGAGSPKPDRLLREFGGINEIYNASGADYADTDILSEKEIHRLCNKSLQKSETIVEACMKNGYDILTLNEIPQRLRDIYAPPCVLYVWGSIPRDGDGINIAMVGTRNVTPYGVEAATKIAAGLAHYGAVVVSGMAIGVDAASHKGTLKGGGKTVAVIGCGIDINYPSAHKELKRMIAQNGAVVSEFPPGSRPDRTHFPIRNRIIAGLSLGTVVVEAGSRSGSLITASLAAEMGRDIFAVPGSIFSPMSEGTNKLLRDGAKPVCTVLDIMEEYIALYPQSIISQLKERENDEPKQLAFDNAEVRKIYNNSTEINQKDKKPDEILSNVILNNMENKAVNVYNKLKVETQTAVDTGSHSAKLSAATVVNAEQKNNIADNLHANLPNAGRNLSEIQMKVLGQLSDKPMHVDDIALRANIELRRVLAVLTTLEIEGYVISYPGRRYTVFNCK